MKKRREPRKPSLSAGKEHELLLKLKSAGMTDELAQRVISSKGNLIAENVVSLIRSSGLQFSISSKHAHTVLGADFITPEEVTKARPRIVYTDKQMTALAESLPPEDVLKWYKANGFAVMPAPPKAMSMLDVREIQPAHFYEKAGNWFADQEFAQEDKISSGWLAIRKKPVPNSINSTWYERVELLSICERVPNAAEMSWFITTYFEIRGVRLFEDIRVRTSSLGSSRNHVYLGFFVSSGFTVDHDFWDDLRYDDLGLASARKQ